MIRSDMFSLDVVRNSFMAFVSPRVPNYDIMKVSSPVRPLQPPTAESDTPRSIREEL